MKSLGRKLESGGGGFPLHLPPPPPPPPPSRWNPDRDPFDFCWPIQDGSKIHTRTTHLFSMFHGMYRNPFVNVC